MFEFTLPLDAKPTPVRNILKQQGISLTLWRKIKQNGVVLINGLPSNNYSLLHPGDKINLFLQNNTKIIPTSIKLNICFEDEALLIVDKPAGLLVHPTVYERENTLANAVINYYRDQNLSFNFHPVQRLDRNTSGLILIAKHPHIQHILCSRKTFNRHYLAIVHGVLPKYTDIINAPIGRCNDSIIEREVRPDGQSAVTHYKVLLTANDLSLVELKLETGRTHQIRVHLSYIGHPIVGDDLYGGSKLLTNRQLLHAYKLVFEHPLSNNTHTVVSTIPDDFKNVLEKIRS